jgi:hypothetical protein
MKLRHNSKRKKKYNWRAPILIKKGNQTLLYITAASVLVAVMVFALLSNHLYDANRPSGSATSVTKVKGLHLTDLPLLSPASKPNSGQNANLSAGFSHQNIISTYFWVGEPGDSDNGDIANLQSAWDGHWQSHFGGVDDPAHRNGYSPAAFTPKENPFYFALPYNDISEQGSRKSTASACQKYSPNWQNNYSWCKNIWVAIRHGQKVVYAQWEDVGPFEEDDFAYVFGSAAPKNHIDAKAGIDVSPAVKDYLGLQDVDKVDWSFVNASSVPNGIWKQTIATSLGDSIN